MFFFLTLVETILYSYIFSKQEETTRNTRKAKGRHNTTVELNLDEASLYYIRVTYSNYIHDEGPVLHSKYAQVHHLTGNIQFASSNFLFTFVSKRKTVLVQICSTVCKVIYNFDIYIAPVTALDEKPFRPFVNATCLYQDEEKGQKLLLSWKVKNLITIL